MDVIAKVGKKIAFYGREKAALCNVQPEPKTQDPSLEVSAVIWLQKEDYKKEEGPRSICIDREWSCLKLMLRIQNVYWNV